MAGSLIIFRASIALCQVHLWNLTVSYAEYTYSCLSYHRVFLISLWITCMQSLPY